MIRNKLLILFLILFSFSHSWANPKIDLRSGILIDYHSGKILYEENADHQIYPASMTKIMTAIIAFDLLKDEKIKLSDEVLISENAWRMSRSGYSSMFIMLNDKVTIEELLRGIIIVSGNDACVALAEGIAGTESAFADMMNDKAAEIGLENTNFSNASGINDPDNYSTVRDIAIMSKYLINNYPVYYEYFKEKEFTWDRTGGDPITQGNRNPLLYKNIGADGIKTGYLAVEKYSLASSVVGKDRRLIAVGSGFQTKQARSTDSMKLISWGFRNTATYEIAKKDETNFNFKTWLGKKDIVQGIVKEDVYLTIPKKSVKDFKVFIKYKEPIKAPIKKDQEIGTLIVESPEEEEEAREITVYASENVKKVNFFKSLFMSFNYMIWGDA